MSVPEKVLFKLRVPLLQEFTCLCESIVFCDIRISVGSQAFRSMCFNSGIYIILFHFKIFHIKEKRKQVTVKLDFFPLFCDKQMQAHAQFMLVCDGSQCHIGIVMTVL